MSISLKRPFTFIEDSSDDEYNEKDSQDKNNLDSIDIFQQNEDKWDSRHSGTDVNLEVIDRFKKKSLKKHIKLPGGYIEEISLKEQPKKITKLIRKVFDIYLSTIALFINPTLDISSPYTGDTDNNQSSKNPYTSSYNRIDFVKIIPYIVQNILRYNNIVFKSIKLYVIPGDLHEPLWYKFSIIEKTLTLYMSKPIKDKFCMRSKKYPVISTSGIINLKEFNPKYSAFKDDDFNPQSQSIINCMILCDHLCQHIITEWMHKLNKESFPQSETLHYHFKKYGTTLHSIFDLTRHMKINEIEKDISLIDTFNINLPYL